MVEVKFYDEADDRLLNLLSSLQKQTINGCFVNIESEKHTKFRAVTEKMESIFLILQNESCMKKRARLNTA